MRGLALAGLATLAAGCVDDHTAASIYDVRTHHPVGFTAQTETLFVEVGPNGNGLSSNQENDVLRFIERYKAESSGALRIAAPKSARGHLTASHSMRQVEQIVENSGIDPRAVQVSRLSGQSRYGPAIKLDYDREIAVPPECGDWSDDLGENRERLPYNNFGCATQRNFALNVANARDLHSPRQETPASAERRNATWSEYVYGKGTAVTSGGVTQATTN
jgi:pilus assembly protein CpaD